MIDIDDDVLQKLEERARRNGHSTDEEVREILRDAVKSEGSAAIGLGTRLAAIFSGIEPGEEIPELRSTYADEH